MNLKDFYDQVKFIVAVQDAVLQASSDKTGIPMNANREPADLLRFGKGLCFDRSHVIEKIMTSLGFDIRDVAVYSTEQNQSAFIFILTPQIPSHAVSEVKTARGWMLVDSNNYWIGLTADNRPASIRI